MLNYIDNPGRGWAASQISSSLFAVTTPSKTGIVETVREQYENKLTVERRSKAQDEGGLDADQTIEPVKSQMKSLDLSEEIADG